jgi:hypothetical protein
MNSSLEEERVKKGRAISVPALPEYRSLGNGRGKKRRSLQIIGTHNDQVFVIPRKHVWYTWHRAI